jgi:hypothetical protein
MNSSKTCVENTVSFRKEKTYESYTYGHRVKFLSPEYDHLSVLIPEI